MADDADAVDAEELGAAVFGVIHFLVDLLQVPLHEEVAELGEDVLGDLVAGHGQDALDDPLRDLEGDVPGEAVADDDVGDAGEQVLALDVADEAQGRRLEPVEGLAHEVVALALFLADAHQADPGVLQADDRLHEDLAHDRELDEVVGLAVGVGPDVDEQGLSLEPGDEEGQGRPVHALEGTQDVAGDVDDRSGVAHADEGVGPAVLDELGPDPDGGGLLFPEGEEALAHADRLRARR